MLGDLLGVIEIISDRKGIGGKLCKIEFRAHSVVT